MMRWLTASAALATGCGDKGDDTGADPDDAIAADLWDALEGYESWGQHDPWVGVQASSDGTHGDYVQAWLNDAALAAVDAGTDVPDGAIIVKEGYSDSAGADLLGLTAMYKVADFDPDHGDWFWAKFDPDSGDASLAGAVSACYGCHAEIDANGNFVSLDDVVPGG